MTITTKNNYSYASEQSDLKEILIDYSRSVTYLAQHFQDIRCKCGNTKFNLFTDETEGVAVRHCASCQTDHPIADSAEFLDDATLEKNICLCGNTAFEITVGISLYNDSTDVKWLYIGCRCPECQLSGCYGDWKNETTDYKNLLSKA